MATIEERLEEMRRGGKDRLRDADLAWLADLAEAMLTENRELRARLRKVEQQVDAARRLRKELILAAGEFEGVSADLRKGLDEAEKKRDEVLSRLRETEAGLADLGKTWTQAVDVRGAERLGEIMRSWLDTVGEWGEPSRETSLPGPAAEAGTVFSEARKPAKIPESSIEALEAAFVRREQPVGRGEPSEVRPDGLIVGLKGGPTGGRAGGQEEGRETPGPDSAPSKWEELFIPKREALRELASRGEPRYPRGRGGSSGFKWLIVLVVLFLVALVGVIVGLKLTMTWFANF